MEKKEYIERERAIQAIRDAQPFLGSLMLSIDSVPSADAVPWSWLEQYATGKRCNFASGFVSEARKEWENGTTDIFE